MVVVVVREGQPTETQLSLTTGEWKARKSERPKNVRNVKENINSKLLKGRHSTFHMLMIVFFPEIFIKGLSRKGRSRFQPDIQTSHPLGQKVPLLSAMPWQIIPG